MAKTRAQANRAVRQEALREQLAAQGHVQHVIDIAKKLSNLEDPLDATEVARLKAAADIKRSLINKYLPDLKAIEHTGEGGSAIEIKKAEDLTDEELAAIAAGSSEGASEA